MDLRISEEEAGTAFEGYARVPIAFTVREAFAVEPAEGGLGGLRLKLRPVPAPWVKDYDAEPGNHPAGWPERFDVSRWGVLVARSGHTRVGGAIVAWEEPGGRGDVAVLWDLRVAPELRGRGVGAALFRAAERWAAEHGACTLSVETQNVNVPACRFYAAMGCTLVAIHRHAYPTLPDEAQLIWYKPLGT